MSKPKKWAKRSKPTTPVSTAAKDSIEYRLQSAWRFAPLAAKQAAEDVEYVHQLRVCIRRANAALKLYAPLLPRKKTRRIRNQLRELRRAAGPARDLDVLADRLSQLEPSESGDGMADLRDVVRVQRKKAQKPLKRAYRDAKRGGFVTDADRLVKSVRWRALGSEPDYATFAKRTFQPIVDRFFVAGRADLRDVEALHQMRIRGKAVRYAMELLSPAFEGAFRKEIYPVFAEVQEKLGTVNDHASANRFYRGLLASPDLQRNGAIIQEMVECEVNAFESSRLAFLDWWTPQHIAQMQSKFDAVLQSNNEEVLRMVRDSLPDGIAPSSAG